VLYLLALLAVVILPEIAPRREIVPEVHTAAEFGLPLIFVLIALIPVEPDPPELWGPWFLWKLLIDERQQGRGLGREVGGAIVDIVRREGGDALITSYGEGPGGPGGFYRGLGFVPTGDVDHDEIVARLPIS